MAGGEGADHANGEERRKSERRRRRGAQSARSGREGPGEDHAQVQAVATADGTEQCDSAEDGTFRSDGCNLDNMKCSRISW